MKKTGWYSKELLDKLKVSLLFQNLIIRFLTYNRTIQIKNYQNWTKQDLLVHFSCFIHIQIYKTISKIKFSNAVHVFLQSGQVLIEPYYQYKQEHWHIWQSVNITKSWITSSQIHKLYQIAWVFPYKQIFISIQRKDNAMYWWCYKIDDLKPVTIQQSWQNSCCADSKIKLMTHGFILPENAVLTFTSMSNLHTIPSIRLCSLVLDEIKKMLNFVWSALPLHDQSALFN